MNDVVQEMMSYYGISKDEPLEHEGVARRSGRYPWGSGGNPYQRTGDFLSRVEQLKKEGWSETPENIKNAFGMTTTQYRVQKALSKDDRRMLDVARAKSLKEDGFGETEIARQMSVDGRKVNESTVRSWLNADSEARMNQAKETASFIKKMVDENGPMDVGVGVERELNISSREKLNQALAILEMQGYRVQSGRVEQATNKGQMTTIKAIMPPDSEPKDFYKFTKGEANIGSLTDYISRDGGTTFEKKFTYPESLDSKRLKIRYNEDGGIDKDGVIELRRGVDDLSLGSSRYAQVRIMVDGTHYLKGMAVYSDNMPDGVDVVFNTNKNKGTPMTKVLKPIKDDPDNPFGSTIKDAEKGGQYWYDGKDGKKHLGLVNKTREEDEWNQWKDTLPSQFLSKQALPMAKKQLDLAYADKAEEYDEYCKLTNPTLKKHMLSKFADECDSAAVHLQAAALPGQKYHVILPINSLKESEVYAPGYEQGSKLALIRYPHAGTFEIPILTVNNKNTEGASVIGKTSIDAIGITKKVADRLSGADFDGDTVMCIPTHDKAGKVKITSRELQDHATSKLPKLIDFDPTMAYGPEKTEVDADGKEYGYRNGKKYAIMQDKTKQIQMGVASNLICDMTLRGADDDEMACAVRHSMVVIDAVKHKLDYKQSEVDNNISSLKKKYQTGGASTLISRAKGQEDVVKRQGSPIINVKTKANGKPNPDYDSSKPEGSLIWKKADDADYVVTKVNKKTGEVTTVTKTRTQKSTHMAETNDARTLISEANTPMERAYADYANHMKSLGNQARKEMMSTGKIEYSSSAKNTYAKEVSSLSSKLNTALLNAPRERQANLRANAEINAKKIAYKEKNGKDMPAKDEKKLRQQSLSKYRQEVNSVSRKERSIKITDSEWDAIQAGAISENNLKKILNNTDIDELRQRATPRASSTPSASQINKAKAMNSSNYTLEEIAKATGMSSSTISKYLKGVN